MTTNPKLIFSYQGAFGPPTYGHYKAMEAFAEEIVKKYIDDYDIEMLFMPTAQSNSKKHLAPTQRSRINILNKFCTKLNEKFRKLSKINFRKLSKINFSASEIEYNIYKGNTSTIHTIQKIAEISNISNTNNTNKPNKPNKLILGMGMDNMLQLPYWKNIENFYKKVSEIYIVPRELTKSEQNNIFDFHINGQDTLKFEKFLPWNIKKDIINNTFGIEKENSNESNTIKSFANINVTPTNHKTDDTKDDTNDEIYNKGTDISKLSHKINIKLPNIIFIQKNIPSTSSSMLRHYLSLYNEPNKEEIMKIIEAIIFGKNTTANTTTNIIRNLIEEYGKLFSKPLPETLHETLPETI